MTIYERIKKLREELGLTQEELAHKTGYKSRSAINKIESGQRDINQSQIEDFAKALNVSPAYLMGWEKEKDKEKQVDPVEEEIRSIAAHADGKLTKEDAEKLREYAKFLLSQKKK